jgi:hypothetical protein
MPRRHVDKIIFLHAVAPPKPAEGATCNGCGVCCSHAPCPLGMLLTRRVSGACVALSWNASASLYQCGALVEPKRWLPWLPSDVARRLVLRWIAATEGCDSDLSAV